MTVKFVKVGRKRAKALLSNWPGILQANTYFWGVGNPKTRDAWEKRLAEEVVDWLKSAGIQPYTENSGGWKVQGAFNLNGEDVYVTFSIYISRSNVYKRVKVTRGSSRRSNLGWLRRALERVAAGGRGERKKRAK